MSRTENQNPSFSKRVPDKVITEQNAVVEIFWTYDGAVKPMRIFPGWKCCGDENQFCKEIHTGCCGKGHLKLTIFSQKSDQEIRVERIQLVKEGEIFTVAGNHILQNDSEEICTAIMFTQVPHHPMGDYVSIKK